MLAVTSNEEKHDDLLSRIEQARMETDKVFDLVRPEALYERPIPERHRIIFYRGHLEAFDWNLLQPRLPGLTPFDAHLDRLFAFGIDPVDGGLPSDQPSDWPTEEQVEEYCSRARSRLDIALTETNFRDWADDDESPSTLLHVALEHRLMHAETLAYMLHQLPVKQKRREPQVAVSSGAGLSAERLVIPAGGATLGLSRGDAVFGWDNEFEEHSAFVPAFSIDRFKITNAQYLEFLNAGGYREKNLWSNEGWNWLQREQITHPVFWKQDGAAWLIRVMFDEIPLPLDWPVYVSHAEASAYAKWSGGRLPSELEWHRAAYGTPGGAERQFPWGSQRPGPEHGYFDFRRWDPWPVNAFPRAASAFGVEGLLANGWEWTSTPFQPFEGFRPFPFYAGYSANFFDNQHFVMKGGSTRTADCMLRRSFRNWFQPHYQYVYAGFRCVQD